MYAFNPYAIPVALSGAAVLAIGCLVAVRRFDRLGLPFLAVCAAAALWLLGVTACYLSQDAETALAWDKYVSLLGVIWIPATSYIFAVSFRGTLAARRSELLGAIVLSAMFTVELFTDAPWMVAGMRHYYFGWYSVFGPGMKYFVGVFTIVMAGCLLELYQMYRGSNSGLMRRQALWALAGFTLASMGSWDYLPGYGFEAYPFGYLGVLAFVGSFVYAIEVYDLLDVRTAFVQTGAYSLAWAPYVVPMFASLHALKPYLHLRSSEYGLELVIVAISAAAMAYWHTAGQRLLALLNRRRRAMRRAFDELEQNFRYATGLRETVDATLSTVGSLFDLFHMSYWQVESGGGSARLIAARNLQPPGRLPLPATLARRLSEVEEVQEPRDLPKDFDTRKLLDATQAALVLPVRKGADLIGFFILGPKRTLAAFKGPELDLLNDFRRRLSLALTGAVLADQVHEMASQVMLAEQRAREVEKIKADFLQAVSHELRTPLSALSGYAEVLMDAPASGQEGRFLQTIHNASQRIAGLVADMIRAASLERETLEVRASWFPFATAAERVLEPFRRKIALVRFSLDADPGLRLFADRDKIEDVLFRLLSNAVKFSPPDGVVQVWGRASRDGFEFGVVDQGPGMSESALKHAFEKFNRPYDGQDEVNLRNPGSGLGLYIAKTLVEMHRGQIQLEPAARGCRVVVRLPQPTPATVPTT